VLEVPIEGGRGRPRCCAIVLCPCSPDCPVDTPFDGAVTEPKVAIRWYVSV